MRSPASPKPPVPVPVPVLVPMPISSATFSGEIEHMFTMLSHAQSPVHLLLDNGRHPAKGRDAVFGRSDIRPVAISTCHQPETDRVPDNAAPIPQSST